MSIAAAKVTKSGKVVQLNAKPTPEEVVSEEDVKQPTKLARLLTRILAELAALRRRFAPRHIDFEDITIASGGHTFQLHHGFGCRVRWWLVDYENTGATIPAHIQKWRTLTDNDNIGFWTDSDSLVTIRVEECP